MQFFKFSWIFPRKDGRLGERSVFHWAGETNSKSIQHRTLRTSRAHESLQTLGDYHGRAGLPTLAGATSSHRSWMSLWWDTCGKKPNEAMERISVPLNSKSLIRHDRGSPPLGTTSATLWFGLA